MIDKVFIFSVARAKDRQQWCKQHLLEKAFPESIIDVWNGLDNADFKTSLAVLQYAIEKRGYTFLKKSLALGLHRVSPIAWLAQSIAFLDIFKHISEDTQNSMILFDDHTVSRGYHEINNVIQAEIPTDFYGIFMAQPAWFEELHLIKDLKNKDTWAMIPEKNRATMNGLQVPSESGMILSPSGASFFRERFIELLTTKEGAYATSFVLALNHQLCALNRTYKHKLFSFVFSEVHVYHYAPDIPCLIESEEGILRRPISETSYD